MPFEIVNRVKEVWLERSLYTIRPRVWVALALLAPAILLIYRFFGETGLMAIAFSFPILLAFLRTPRRQNEGDTVTGLPLRDEAVRRIGHWLTLSARHRARSGVLLIEIDNFAEIEQNYGRSEVEEVLRECARRLSRIMMRGDLVCRLDGATFAIVPGAARGFDLEAAMNMAGRTQSELAGPIQLGATNVYPNSNVGFALISKIEKPEPELLLQGAKAALVEARRAGPGAVRSYSEAMRRRIVNRNGLAGEVADALENGEICAYYQPQLATQSRTLSGIETLARWHHPERGLIPPVEFLPALEQSGLMEKLGETMVREALTALRAWDAKGLHVPRIAVNFSGRELSDPGLVDKIGFELDRFGIAAPRLVVEVLETVVAGKAEDNVIRNLSGLARLGCCMDLDDFGTGHASITSIRRFSIERIKIDRSFVSRIDQDEEQQKMVSAILTMAERLGLDTLAEGVESEAEIEMLAKLGCAHVQGFVIARPMPMSEAEVWVAAHQERAPQPLALPRRAG